MTRLIAWGCDSGRRPCRGHRKMRPRRRAAIVATIEPVAALDIGVSVGAERLSLLAVIGVVVRGAAPVAAPAQAICPRRHDTSSRTYSG
jgi:hypothetical protein